MERKQTKMRRRSHAWLLILAGLFLTALLLLLGVKQILKERTGNLYTGNRRQGQKRRKNWRQRRRTYPVQSCRLIQRKERIRPVREAGIRRSRPWTVRHQAAVR
ncbi:hypothetical protein CLS_14720 [[Clostridium] cf. saccharolyticum K10]|nr:hypothetical protein CLS_14720 [[Clostridium] cf. saccharolyticum K10]